MSDKPITVIPSRSNDKCSASAASSYSADCPKCGRELDGRYCWACKDFTKPKKRNGTEHHSRDDGYACAGAGSSICPLSLILARELNRYQPHTVPRRAITRAIDQTIEAGLIGDLSALSAVEPSFIRKENAELSHPTKED